MEMYYHISTRLLIWCSNSNGKKKRFELRMHRKMIRCFELRYQAKHNRRTLNCNAIDALKFDKISRSKRWLGHVRTYFSTLLAALILKFNNFIVLFSPFILVKNSLHIYEWNAVQRNIRAHLEPTTNINACIMHIFSKNTQRKTYIWTPSQKRQWYSRFSLLASKKKRFCFALKNRMKKATGTKKKCSIS